MGLIHVLRPDVFYKSLVNRETMDGFDDKALKIELGCLGMILLMIIAVLVVTSFLIGKSC